MSDHSVGDIELSESEYNHLKRGLEEYAQLLDVYGGNFSDEIRDTRVSLDEISEVKYVLPVFRDIEAAVGLLELRHGLEIADVDADDLVGECGCGSLYVTVHEEVECVNCGKVHTASEQPGGQS